MKDPIVLGHGIQLWPRVFTLDECQVYVSKAEALGFEAATINTAEGAVLARTVRNNDRVIHDDLPLALELWRRLALCLPEVWMGRNLAGINERFRFYRYAAHQQFDWHVDGAFERSNGEKSLLTVLIYLSGGYVGGETTFDVAGEQLSCKGEMGDVLVFPHRLRHKGSPVTAGLKYMLRSDAMYSPLVGVAAPKFPSVASLRDAQGG